MKKSALKFLLFLIVFLAYDKLFILVANRSAETEVDRRLEYLIEGNINKELVVLGASRGSRDIIASQIEKETGLSAYNLCYPGSSVEFHEFILHTLINFNKAPEILLLVVDDFDEFLDGGNRVIFRRDRLYPLVKYPYVRKEMAKRGYVDNDFSRFIVLQRLNKYNFDLRQKRFMPNDTVFACGSMTYSWQRKGVNWEYNLEEREYPMEQEIPEKITVFKNMINTSKEKNIKLVLLFPPNYRPPSQSFEDRIRTLSGENVYYHYYNKENPIYKNSDYYYDTDHLIQQGATIYTDEIVDFLNGIIEGSVHPGFQ